MYIKNYVNDITIRSNFDEKEYVKSETYAVIPLENGKSVYVQGAKYGIWYLSPNIWDGIVTNGNYACLCTGDGEFDFKIIRSEEDINRIAKSTQNILMKMAPTKTMDIMDTIKSVINSHDVVLDGDIPVEQIYTDRDVHLMMMVHKTPDSAVNSLFDRVFNNEDYGFGLDE